MKNFNLRTLVLSSVIFISACSNSKNTTVAPANRNDLRGKWTLNDVSVTGLGKYDEVKIQVFDDADMNCFKGSTWNLPNNNYGSYTLQNPGAGCSTGARNIVWGYRQENGETLFTFKKLQEGVKAKNIEEGYKLKIVSATSDAMVLQSQVLFENKTLTLNYQFSKQ